MSSWTILGPYVAGEIPEAWIHTFTDNEGTAIDISGFTVRVAYKRDGGSQVLRNGSVADGPAGEATYGWIAGDVDTAGLVRGEMWIGNGSNRYARQFEMRVVESFGGTAPSI